MNILILMAAVTFAQGNGCPAGTTAQPTGSALRPWKCVANAQRGQMQCPAQHQPYSTGNPRQPFVCEWNPCKYGYKPVPTGNAFQPYKCIVDARRRQEQAQARAAQAQTQAALAAAMAQMRQAVQRQQRAPKAKP